MLIYMLWREKGVPITEVEFVIYFANGFTQISFMISIIKGHDTLGLGVIFIKDLIG